MQLPIDGFWGKARRSPDGSAVEAWHPLEDHCIDVATTFRALCELDGIKRSLDAAVGSELTSAQVDRLAVFALLHDVGKFNLGFQGKLAARAPQVGHVLESAGLFGLGEVATEALAIARLSAWFVGGVDSFQSMLFASISHHGEPLSLQRIEREDACRRCARWWSPAGTLDPVEGVRRLIAQAQRILPNAFDEAPPIEATTALQHRFAGLVMLADWIGSDTSHFPYRHSPDEDRVATARFAAVAAIHAIGLHVQHSRCDLARRAPTFSQVFGRSPHPLQQLLADEIPVNDSARLLVAESETGSGKTEAALAWFLRLFREARVDGMYFALPTRVAARELYGRVVAAMHAAFPGTTERLAPVLLAVPGYARTDGSPTLLPRPEGTLWPDGAREAARDRAWVAENPKRFLAAPVAVGTIDQALLSVLKVRHAHLRSVCLDRLLLVIDEVHASDTYMRRVMQALLAHHRSVGGWSLLLSATLGEGARAAFLGRRPAPLAQAQDAPYPAVSSAIDTIPLAGGSGREKTVRVEFVDALEDFSAIVALLADALSQGARVLAVMNTVGRAVALMRAAEQSGRIDPDHLFAVRGVRCPHHGRFAREDREVLDRAVTERFGPATADGPVLAIGTQTLEQSLDIDADLLVTDHCPMDVLLQRIGRLHRHRRNRPQGFGSARCIVLGPPADEFERFIRPNRKGEGLGPAGLGTVYEDLRVLKLTRDVLQARAEIEIPRDNRRLVESTTHPDALSSLSGDRWTLHAQFLVGSELTQRRAADLGVIEALPFGELAFGELRERVTTRLGLSDRMVRLPHEVLTPFGQRVVEIAMPGHLAPRDEAVDAANLEAGAEGFRFTLADRRYSYSRFGLELLRDE